MTQIVDYAYRPLANARWQVLGGTVYKCAGICDADNYDWLKRQWSVPEGGYAAGMLVVEGYHGDKIVMYDEEHNYPQ